MNLFENSTDLNILPYDGTVLYPGKVFDQTDANKYLELLLEHIGWRHDEAIIFGKHIITARMVAWYGDAEYSYSYSGITRHALPWTKELLELKAIAEQHCGILFNSCLLNLYHNGDEGMAWHSDDEAELGKNTTIASMSFGAERKFAFKHKKTSAATSLVLEHGSLLIMKDATQSHWMHSLPKTKKVKRPRINLTFRTIIKN